MTYPLRQTAYHGSSYLLAVSIGDGTVIPLTLSWTLATEAGAVVNGRRRVAAAIGGTVTTIILSGDDLAILDGETGDTVTRYILIEATYSYGGETLPWKREYELTVSRVPQRMIAPADELSSYLMRVAVLDVTGAQVAPATMTWTLTASQGGAAINSGVVASPTLETPIILSGDDLAILEGETGDTVTRYILVEATYSYGGVTLPWKREYELTISRVPQRLIAPADELSSYLMRVAVLDVTGAQVAPATMTWTLTASQGGEAINSGVVASPALETPIILSGDDLAILEGETGDTVTRYILIEATYSYGGVTLPWRRQYQFTLNNLRLAPLPTTAGSWDDGLVWEDMDIWHDL